MNDCSTVAVLYAREDSIYKTLPGCDVWDEARDARNYAGPHPVVAHPPCGQWGRLRAFARKDADEKALGLLAVDQVRHWKGVLEHPIGSELWPAAGLPLPGRRDEFGGWTMPVHQFWFGHQAEKRTWLYICGVDPEDIPEWSLTLGQAPCVVETTSTSPVILPRMKKSERNATPLVMAEWLVELARRVKQGVLL